MNGDGHQDIVVNYAQHIERIDVLYRTKNGPSSPIRSSRPYPLWGSMAIGVVDGFRWTPGYRSRERGRSRFTKARKLSGSLLLGIKLTSDS